MGAFRVRATGTLTLIFAVFKSADDEVAGKHEATSTIRKARTLSNPTDICPATLPISSNGVEAMSAPEYSLSDTPERLYNNQLALEAAIRELALLVESQGHAVTGENIRGALQAIGKNEGYIRQGLAKLVLQHRGDD